MRTLIRPVRRWAGTAAGRAELSRFAVWGYSGKERETGRPLAFAYAGLESQKNYLAKIAFKPGAEGRFWGDLTPEEVGERAASGLPACSALFFEVGHGRGRFFRHKPRFRIPVWVDVRIDASRGLVSLRRFARRSPFRFAVSSETAHLDEFYKDLYAPFAFRSGGFVHSFEEVRRRWASGELLLAGNETGIIAGILIQYEGSGCVLSCMGIRCGNADVIAGGIVSSLVYHSLLRAKERGHERVDLGYSRGFLKDGPLRFKMRMGASVAAEYHRESGWIGVKALKADDAGLRAFFMNNPFISINAAGRFRACVFSEKAPVDAAGARQLAKEAFCEGLSGLDVYAFDGSPSLRLKSPGERPDDIRILSAHDRHD